MQAITYSISVKKLTGRIPIFMWVSELGLLLASKFCVVKLSKTPQSNFFFFLPTSYFLSLPFISYFSKLIIMIVDKVRFSGYPAMMMDECDEVNHCWKWKLA